MTHITSAARFALSPAAFSGNSGGGFIGAPLAIVVIGGLFTSTLLGDAQAQRFAAVGGR